LLSVITLCASLPGLGRWLVREDPVRQSDAIAVLTGNFPARAIEAADLYRDGYANEIWLTHPGPRTKSAGLNVAQIPTEDVFNYDVLRSMGVPAGAIHILDTPIVNTADELNVIDSTLKETGEASVIVVTNKAHTRRVHSIWTKYHSGEGEMIVHAVADDQFSPSSWWKSQTDKLQVAHELLGMLNLWAGLPVHRTPRPSGSLTSSDAPVQILLPTLAK